VRIGSDTLEALEFAFVRGLLAARTVTPMGVALAGAVAPLDRPEGAAASLDATGEAIRLLESEGPLPLRGLVPVEEIFADLRPEGSVLAGAAIVAALRFCEVVEAVRSRRAGLRPDFPILAGLTEALAELATIVKAISGRITPAGELEDHASAELGRIRARIVAATGTIRSRLESMLAREGASKIYSDSFITERGGRFVLPVRSDAPVPVRGIVHGGSSSGATHFVEPLATVELNNELVRLRDLEAAEIERILREWTARLRARLDDLIAAGETLGALDLVQAKGTLARDLAAVRPAFDPEGGILLREARHPLLERTLAKAGGRMVPLDLSLPAGAATLIVSGPNAGGKTVVLKTTGLLALMAHAGLHVPAREASFPWLRDVLVDIGDRQSIEGSLSTFSAHIKNLSEIASRVAPPSLVLIDEIGTGTDPIEGGALAVALLEHLRERGALTIATTHHGPVKLYGIETPGVASAAVEFDEATLAPTYRLLPGIAGASAGLAIAARLGLDPAVVEAARGRIAPGEREAEGYLLRLRELVGNLEEDRRELERHRVRLEEASRRAREEAIRSDHERAERFRGELAEALESFRESAREQARGLSEKRETIRLDKDRAKREAELRREFERLHREAAPLEPLPGEGARPRGNGRRGATAGGRGGSTSQGGAEEADAAPFVPSPGRLVLVGPYGREGTIESIQAGIATVLVGTARFKVPVAECLPAGSNAGRSEPPRWKAPRPAVAIDRPEGGAAAREINLIGLTVEEGMERLDKFLDEAFVSRLSEVRIIHGHGTGRLRTAVRELLGRHPHVASHRPGAPAEGGNGATVASLNA
jgi:DNA mismatch repair protein MutS2